MCNGAGSVTVACVAIAAVNAGMHALRECTKDGISTSLPMALIAACCVRSGDCCVTKFANVCASHWMQPAFLSDVVAVAWVGAHAGHVSLLSVACDAIFRIDATMSRAFVAVCTMLAQQSFCVTRGCVRCCIYAFVVGACAAAQIASGQ